METVERSGAGYIVKLTPSSLNGNSYYAEYTTRHTVM